MAHFLFCFLCFLVVYGFPISPCPLRHVHLTSFLLQFSSQSMVGGPITNIDEDKSVLANNRGGMAI